MEREVLASLGYACSSLVSLPHTVFTLPLEADQGAAGDIPELSPSQDGGNKKPKPSLVCTVPKVSCSVWAEVAEPGTPWRQQSQTPYAGLCPAGGIPAALCGAGGCTEELLVWEMVVLLPELGSSQTGTVPQILVRAGKGNGATMHEKGRLQWQKHPTGSENCCRIGLEMS